VKRPGTAVEPIIGIKRKRTFRSCVPCRESKVKCSGERPKCNRCSQRRTSCIYDAEANEPAWVHSIAASNGNTPDGALATTPQAPQTPQTPHNIFTSMQNDSAVAECPPALTWYGPDASAIPLHTNSFRVGCSPRSYHQEPGYMPSWMHISTTYIPYESSHSNISPRSFGC
jgi:hypothetical protein